METRAGTDWSARLRLACQVLACASGDGPAMAIEIEGTLRGPAGQAAPVLLLARRLAVERGLRQQASLHARTLCVRLTRDEAKVAHPNSSLTHHGAPPIRL